MWPFARRPLTATEAVDNMFQDYDGSQIKLDDYGRPVIEAGAPCVSLQPAGDASKAGRATALAIAALCGFGLAAAGILEMTSASGSEILRPTVLVQASSTPADLGLAQLDQFDARVVPPVQSTIPPRHRPSKLVR